MDAQSWLALAVTAGATVYLVRRSLAALRGRSRGCGTCDGCHGGDATSKSMQPVKKPLYSLQSTTTPPRRN